MDNQFDNNYYGFEPQRPVTEKQSDAPEENFSGSAGENAPVDQPLTAPPVSEPEGDYGTFNPIRHTAVYSDNRFSSSGQYQQTGGYQPVPPVIIPTVSVQNVEPDSEKIGASKANTALVVVIIVMGVMLAASMLGIFSYTLRDAAKNKTAANGKDNSNSAQTEIISPTTPNSGGFPDIRSVPQTTEPQKVHDETDFSDKTDPSYEGITIAEKPADAKTNSSYNSVSANSAASVSVVSVLCYSDEVGDNNHADGEGSGIIISQDGFVITNAHVVGNSKTAYAIKVVTYDGKEYTAGVVGFDTRTDIAVLKLVDAKDLKAATFGNSDALTLGEDLIIIGNPGGIEYQNSMTKGIVSALNREASTKNIVKYIQTDAAINPGNSGGPAVNIYGQVVGIASAKIAADKFEGMGFCIPSVQSKRIVDSLIRNGYVEGRVRIGISGTAVSSTEAEYYGVPQGILVQTISEDGPCDGTDLKLNDIITELDGTRIKSFSEIYEVLEGHKPGDEVKLKFYRYSDGKEYETDITLQEDK